MEKNFVKLLTKDKEIRLFLVDATKALERSHIHEMKTDEARRLYTNIFIHCCLLSGFLTEVDQRINVSIRFQPEGYTAFCDVNGRGQVNCVFSPQLAAFTGDFVDLLGDRASLSISRGSWREGMFTGTVEMKATSIDACFSYFYSKSEQIKTIFRTWIKDGVARGCLIQPLPFSHLDRLQLILDQLDRSANEIVSAKWTELPTRIFPDANKVDEYVVLSECNCTKEMFVGMLMSLESEELQKSIKAGKWEELECGICGRKYRFGVDDLRRIVKMKERGQSESVS